MKTFQQHKKSIWIPLGDGFEKQVKCLYLGGNPFVRQTKHYRRMVIGKLSNLMHLDQRGVDNEQRMVSQAWVAEGEAGFKAAREKIVALRRQKKQEQRDEIMKNIDVHRKNKINVFEGNIIDAEKQIQKLRGYMRDPNNSDQVYFYEYRIAELMQKIRENQQFIDGIYKRMGLQPLPPIYTIELDEPKKEEQEEPTAENDPNTTVEQQKNQETGENEIKAKEDTGDRQSKVAESSNGESKEVQDRSSFEKLDCFCVVWYLLIWVQRKSSLNE